MMGHRPVRGVSNAAGRIGAPYWWVTALLFAAWCMAFIDRGVLLLLIPAMKTSLDLSDTQFSTLHGLAFSLPFTLAGLPMGKLVDRTNRRNLLIFGMMACAIGTLGCGLSPGFWGIFISRMIVGLGEATLAPASLSMVSDFAPFDRRGRITAIVVSGSAIGGALSNIMSGILLDRFQARPPLTIPFFGPIEAYQSTLVVAGVLPLVLVVALLTLREPARIASIKGAPFQLWGYLLANRKAFLPFYAALIFYLMATYGASSWWPSVFMRIFQLSPSDTGLVIGGSALFASMVSAWGGGILSDQFAHRSRGGGRIALVFLCMLGSAAVLMALLYPVNLVVLIGADVIYSVMMMSAGAAIYATLFEIAPNQGRGQIVALYLVIGSLLGLGGAPTAVAMVTDYVFADENKVNLSICMFSGTCFLLAALLMRIAMPHTARLARHNATAGDRA